jgi:hypothetical protein
VKTKKSLRDTIAENQRAMNMWASAHGKEQTVDFGVKEKRTYSRKMADEDREDDVVREVGQLLAVHPKILFAWRQNSGSAESKSGAPVVFYRFLKGDPSEITLPDFLGVLKDGRLLALEAKNRLWTAPKKPHEKKQLHFILQVKYAGGVSGFCTSAAQAQRIIEE